MDRFTVSHEGMREQHAGRAPWELVKELIQNAWDEAPQATVCTVTIKKDDDAHTLITVSDDGPGFVDIADAYTLMKPTPKRADPTKRGRFNLGEKEFVSVSIRADIKTVGKTVRFPPSGGRRVVANDRTSGTEITATMPWDSTQALELETRLRKFRPTDCALSINGWQIPTRAPAVVHNALMETVLQDGPGEPVRKTRRRTEIHLLQPVADNAWLYEMGIPIQEIDGPWDVDVQQKVPMPPNRTEVPARYVNAIHAECLNAAHELMDPQGFGEEWVKMAMNEDRTSPDAIASTIKGRYGEEPLFTSSDANANLLASEKGHQLVNPRSLTPKERKRFKEDGGMLTTKERFKEELYPDPTNTLFVLPTKNEDKPFVAWVDRMARACGLDPKVEFIHQAGTPKGIIAATCTADTMAPTVRFNKAALPPEFFAEPFYRPEQLELLIHEFGHAIAQLGMEHGPKWGHGVAKAGSAIAVSLVATQAD